MLNQFMKERNPLNVIFAMALLLKRLAWKHIWQTFTKKRNHRRCLKFYFVCLANFNKKIWMFEKKNDSFQWTNSTLLLSYTILVSILFFLLPPFSVCNSIRRSSSPSEHFQIKQGQGYLVGIICPLIRIGFKYLLKISGDKPFCPHMFGRACS